MYSTQLDTQISELSREENRGNIPKKEETCYGTERVGGKGAGHREIWRVTLGNRHWEVQSYAGDG